MLTVEEALERVLGVIPALNSELMPLARLYDRVVSEDVLSPRNVPPWDNSAMDGYAVIAADTGPEQVCLILNEVVGAGQVATKAVVRGTATGVMTGAPVPDGADAVVMIERTDGSQSGTVRITGEARVGQHIRPMGGDIRLGARVLEAGTVLTPPRVGLVASLGLAELAVKRRPIVAVLSTGDEIVAPGMPLGPGQIYSSNNVTLGGLVKAAGGTYRDMGNSPDDLEQLEAHLEKAASGSDIVITTGGVSVGVYDHVKEAFGKIGGSVDFWKVRMKPGKPLAYGVLERGGRRVPLFGLPGNPVSCTVNFLQFVRPVILKALGLSNPFLGVVDAVAMEDIPEKTGRANLIRVCLESGKDGWQCRSTGTQSSGALSSMAHAHGLLAVGIEDEGPKAGDRVRVQLLDASFLDQKEPGYGW